MIEDLMLNIDNVKQGESFNGDAVHSECLIDYNKLIEKPPIAISCGSGYDGDIPLVTYGNFACLVGASKSYKSFFKSALISCYIGGTAQSYFENIKGHDTKGKYIIDIDTEQGEYHVQKASKRVISMIGNQYKGYISFALRPKTPEERVKFIDWIFNESQYKDKIGLMSIDGAADLVNNVNDLDKANEITQKFMKWSADNNCAIITVIHKNYESNKPTGHLGSAILKKAETVCFIQKEDNIAEVKAKYTRNMPFEDFKFRINENGLPQSLENDNIF